MKMTYTELQQDRKHNQNTHVKPLSAAHAESVKQVLRAGPQSLPSSPTEQPALAEQKPQQASNLQPNSGSVADSESPLQDELKE
jgi:hypothetical protein